MDYSGDSGSVNSRSGNSKSDLLANDSGSDDAGQQIRFTEFQNSLKKEVSAFVQGFDVQAKKMAVRCHIPESRSKEYLAKKTIELMKKEINPQCGAGFHLFSGISDIIDGVKCIINAVSW